MAKHVIQIAVLVSLIVYGLARAEWSEPVPVIEINTDTAEEWSPFISFDGLSLYFARVRSDDFYYGRIFRAARKRPFGLFTSVQEIPGDINLSPGHNLCPWVSPDNLRMYYHNELNGIFTLKVSERISMEEPWPAGTDISELNVLGDRLQAPKLTPDELNIYFNAQDVEGGLGGYDMWTATRPDINSPFGNIRNLSEINTTFNEGGPYISPDNLTLYFSSDRNGKRQVFRTTRPSSEALFGEPEPLLFDDLEEMWDMQPCLNVNGDGLYFMRQLGDDRTTRDIWFSNIDSCCIYYVNAAEGNDSSDGLSSETAFATIQAGINAARNGDQVLVYPDVYSEKISFLGKSVTLQGIPGATGVPVLETCDDSAVLFVNGEGRDSIIKNFVISHCTTGILIISGCPTIMNVTVVSNNRGIVAFGVYEPDIVNSIFWNNNQGDLIQCQARYSCYMGASPDKGNIGDDPLFADADNGDYHLCSQWGRYQPQDNMWYLDNYTSPCIDAGDPNSSVSDEPAPNGSRVNIGAYGGTAFASKSPGQ